MIKRQPVNARAVQALAAPKPVELAGFGSHRGGAIALCIVESNQGIRESLQSLLEAAPQLRCDAVYGTVAEAMLALPDLRPEVLLLDDRLLTGNDIGCITKLKACSPTTQILILTTFEMSDRVFDLVCAGASGDLAKTTPAPELVQDVQWVHAGGSLMSMPTARRVMAHFQSCEAAPGRTSTLTSLEEEIVVSLARGIFYEEIARKVGISILAVLLEVRGIYGKLRVSRNVCAHTGPTGCA